MPSKPATIRQTPANLTDKQRMFASEFVKDCNATQAAIRAGYSPNGAGVQASLLLKNINIRGAIDRVLSGVEDRAEISNAYILGGMKVVADRCMQEVEPMTDGSGNPVVALSEDGETLRPVYDFNASGALKALELLGKHKRLFVDRVEVTGNNGAALDLIGGGLSADEAADKYAELFK